MQSGRSKLIPCPKTGCLPRFQSNSAASSDYCAQKLWNNLLGDSDLIATKVPSKNDYKWEAMPESYVVTCFQSFFCVFWASCYFDNVGCLVAALPCCMICDETGDWPEVEHLLTWNFVQWHCELPCPAAWWVIGKMTGRRSAQVWYSHCITLQWLQGHGWKQLSVDCKSPKQLSVDCKSLSDLQSTLSCFQPWPPGPVGDSKGDWPKAGSSTAVNTLCTDTLEE